jgi:hypothetical protein
MTDATEKLVLRIAGGAAVAGATLLTKKVLAGTWTAATGNKPPVSAEDPELTWREAVAWALLSGAIIGVAQLAAARGTRQLVRRRALTR